MYDPSTDGTQEVEFEVDLHPVEPLLVELRKAGHTKTVHRRIRERVTVEHGLAHLCRRQGPRARYLCDRPTDDAYPGAAA